MWSTLKIGKRAFYADIASCKQIHIIPNGVWNFAEEKNISYSKVKVLIDVFITSDLGF